MEFQISAVNKQYGDHGILENVNLTIFGGEIHGIVGYNGAGKSTMAKIMAGMIQKDSGKLLIDQVEMKEWDVHRAMRRGVFYVDSRTTLLPKLSVRENMLYGLNSVSHIWPFGIMRNRKWMERELDASIRRFGLECRPESSVGELSNSVREVLELLRAKMFHPRVLLIDELDSNVNHRCQEIIWQLVREMRDYGTAIMYISHQVNQVLEVSDRISVLMDAHIVETIRNDREHPESMFDMMFRMVKERPPKTIVAPQAKLIEFSHISNSRLKDFSMYVREGEIAGVMGLEKEGMASIESILFHQYHKGKVYYRESEVKIETPKDAVDSGIVFLNANVMEDYLFSGRTVMENMLPYMLRVKCRDLQKQREICQVYLDKLSIDVAPEDIIDHVSSGYQKKILIARNILAEGELYIFNNPTDNIDVVSKIDIYNIINELKRRGNGIILVSDDYHEIAGISDVIIVVKGGEIVRKYYNFSTDEKIMFSEEQKNA